MTTLLLGLAAGLLLGAGLAAQEPAARAVPTAPATPAIAVQVDPRVELLAIVFRLAGNPEYSQGRLRGYNDAVDAHFGPHRDHAVVRRAKALRQRRGIAYDAVASFAVHLAGIDPPRFLLPLEPRPARLEPRWTTADAEAFRADLADFVATAKATAFFAAQRDLYAHAEAQARELLRLHARLDWFATFFGARPTASFQVVLGLLQGGGNYGPSVQLADGQEQLYALLGCWQSDAEGRPLYPRTVVPTLVHEFCHSYCNPVVDQHLAALQPHGDALFARVEAAMRAQAYANGRTLLCESLVRACVVRYRAAVEGDRAAAEELREQHARSFLWTADLAAALRDGYEAHRDRYPSFAAFAPELVPVFRDALPKLEALQARQPKVQAMAPANGATDVDPATAALVVTFDRPMRDRGWSVVGGGEHFPKLTGQPSYDAARRVLTIPVQLRPDWDYELWLNQGRYQSFQSEDGVPLAPVKVTFRTRAE